jgi:hypothetical protein
MDSPLPCHVSKSERKFFPSIPANNPPTTIVWKYRQVHQNQFHRFFIDFPYSQETENQRSACLQSHGAFSSASHPRQIGFNPSLM